MSNSTAEKKQLQGVFALWKRKSNKGNVYFSGKTEGGSYLTGFYVTDKKNMKEPDLRVYAKDSEGNLSKDPFCSLWVNATKNGKKILSGSVDGKKVIGFINAQADDKKPYISVYFAEESKPEAPKAEEKKSNKKDTKKEKKADPVEEEVPSDDQLPF